MTRRQLETIRRNMQALRRSQPKAKELRGLASRLGRKRVRRGKEPTYESEAFPHLRPLAIPNHKGRDMPTGTKNSVLTQLEDDWDAWDEALSRQERGNGKGDTK
jgi:hypothetical protein